MQKQWEEFKREYLNICEEGGWDRNQVAARLQSKEDTSASHREGEIEKWNRYLMGCEDPLLQFRKGVVNPEQALVNRIHTSLRTWSQLRVQLDGRAVRERQAELAAKRKALWRESKRRDWKHMTMAEIMGKRPRSD